LNYFFIATLNIIQTAVEYFPIVPIDNIHAVNGKTSECVLIIKEIASVSGEEQMLLVNFVLDAILLVGI